MGISLRALSRLHRTYSNRVKLSGCEIYVDIRLSATSVVFKSNNNYLSIGDEKIQPFTKR